MEGFLGSETRAERENVRVKVEVEVDGILAEAKHIERRTVVVAMLDIILTER